MSVEAMKQALEALEYHQQMTRPLTVTRAAIESLRQAIAEAEKQEPVAWQATQEKSRIETVPAQGTLLPKREWVGLTYQERCELWDETVKYSPSEVRIHDFAKDIEAKLKERNA